MRDRDKVERMHIGPVLLPLHRRASYAFLAACVVLFSSPACGGSDDDAPDRPLVVYEASADGVTNIYTIDPETAETKQITFGDGFDGTPAWSPDGERIVFVSDRDGQQRRDMYVMDADGANAQRLTDTPDAGELSPRYSPDGTRIAYIVDGAEGWSLWETTAQGTGARQLAGGYAFAEFPAWSPEADELFFAAIERGEAAASGASSIYASSGDSTAHIFSLDMETLDVRTVIRTEGIDVCPHLMPDGASLLYASTRTADNAKHRIYLHDLDSDDTTGSSDAVLTDAAARSDYPDPSPDGARIVFTSDRDGNTEMYVMNADGSEQRRLTNTPDMRENVPDW
jgi:Tol biopolymer transport system component